MPKKLPVTYSASAPKDEARPHIELVRCPPTSTPPYLITADNLIGTQVYWLGGRTCPHLSATPEQTLAGITVECPGCVEGKFHRFVAWLAAFDERKLQHIILEVTANAAEQIGTYRAQFGTLRGSRIVLSRKNGKFNGAQTAALSQSALPQAAIPLPFDLIEQLEFLWCCPNKSDKPKMQTPREIPAKPAARKFDAATKTTSYEATPEQLEMLAANREAAASRITPEQITKATSKAKVQRESRAAATDIAPGRMSRQAAAEFQKDIEATKKKMKQTNGHKR